MNKQYANLGSKIGYIFGSTAICAMIFTYYCVPETKGKSLEDLDVLFVQGVPIQQFNKAVAANYKEDVERPESPKGDKSVHLEDA